MNSEENKPASPVRRSRIFLVEDHPIFRQGLVQTINAAPDLVVCGEAGDAQDALAALSRAEADLALLDISLPGMSGIELIKNIKAEFKELPMLVLSMYDESMYAERAMRAGANGYLTKGESAEKLLGALRCVLGGGFYLSTHEEKRMIGKILQGKGRAELEQSDVSRLSDRELEVFKLIGRGFKTRRIAEALHVSVKTVETHRSHIKEKLSIDDTAELARAAVCWVTQHQIN